MNKLVTIILSLLPLLPLAAQQTELTSQEAKTLYKNTSKKRVSVHDPSVVYSPSNQRYYIFGSHRACAWTSDLQNWTSFNSPWQTASSNNASNATAFTTPVVQKVPKGGEEVDFPQFNAMEWAARTDASYNINGNMWAPDVIWNPTMQKWCQYLSVNGDRWHSSIILLTSDNVEGPYRYQGPVVISGFYDAQHSWKDTDLELVLGEQASLPSRYNTGTSWGNRYPNNIDPCVFFDEEGNLWLAYGSWSGGIWMLELNEENGLRDYDVTYTLQGSGDNITVDPYFGKKIAGGRYVSGEGAYIEHIGDYYYLFMSYGGLEQKGGYEMRVFRSANPDGPYTDPGNRSAVFTSYSLNFGPNATARGQKLLGPYSDWGFMTTGERSQGHNSIIAADDGRTYLVYHTRFCDANKTATEGHQVRVHQVFVNADGWLVASPFEYNGESVTDADVASTQLVSPEQLAGTYSMLVHKFANDHNNLEQVTPVTITLSEDGKVTGKYSGSWTLDEGTSYLTLKLSNGTFKGVVYEPTMDQQNLHAIAFTGNSAGGVGAWAYKLAPKYALAWQLNHQTVPVVNNQSVLQNLSLDGLWQGDPNITMQWTSSHPGIISEHGRYNPTGLSDDTDVTLTARLAAADYYWQQEYTVKALSEQNALPTIDWQTGMVAHYGFDDEALANSLNSAEQAQLLRLSTTKAPALEDGDALRNGNFVHLSNGNVNRESYVQMPNPLYGRELADGASISFWVRRTDANLYGTLFGLDNGTARLYLTGNLYTGYNDGTGNWLDINHPDRVQPTELKTGLWQLVTVVFKRTATSTTGGVTVYVNGMQKRNDNFNGQLDGKTVSTKAAFDYNLIVDHLATCPTLCLGKGSFWGSPDASFDDVVVYDQPLSLAQIVYLNQMMDRVFDFSSLTSGIEEVQISTLKPQPSTLYDLQGRRVSQPQKGLYIVNGKKQIIR